MTSRKTRWTQPWCDVHKVTRDLCWHKHDIDEPPFRKIPPEYQLPRPEWDEDDT